MSKRLTDERVRALSEGRPCEYELLEVNEDDGTTAFHSKEVRALAREVMAARAGDREEREGNGSLEHAIAFAANAHRAQKDKAGEPYILHCLRVMLAVDGYHERCAAVLHDAVEDTATSLDALRVAGFRPSVVEAVGVLTRGRETYEAYIERVATSPMALAVKIADLRDNLIRSRIPNPTDHDERRWQKYERALALLCAAPGGETRAEG